MRAWAGALREACSYQEAAFPEGFPATVPHPAPAFVGAMGGEQLSWGL